MKPKKYLGQNFLKDRVFLEKIIKSAKLSADDYVLEIGPGKGILTQELSSHAGKVIAIEIDDELINVLKDKFKNDKKIEIINGDILKINLPEILNCAFGNNNYKLIANIPYYITSPIIRLFLETKKQPSEIILMLQKEMAERICAKPGNMSIIAVSVQLYADVELLFDVPKSAFWPVPEVDSAVIKISNIKNPPESIEKMKNLFQIVKIGFSQKRKKLTNNLANGLQRDRGEIEEKIKTIGIDPNIRAQGLSVNDWKYLSQIL